jgi:hypothetical protein
MAVSRSDFEGLGFIHVHRLVFRTYVGAAFRAFVKVRFECSELFVTLGTGDSYFAHNTASCLVRSILQQQLFHPLLKSE